MNPGYSDHDVLLEACSILRCFDTDILCNILECDITVAQSIVSAAHVEPCTQGYRLQPDFAAHSYAQFLSRDKSGAMALHQRAFLYYLSRLRQSLRAQHSLDDEDECIYHLNMIFVPLLTQLQWQDIRRYALQVLRAGPRRHEHRMRLRTFLGYALVHLHKYERAEQLLDNILAQSSPEPDIHIKALKALADSSWFRSRYGEALTRYEQLYQAALAADDTIYQGLALLNRAALLHDLEMDDQALDYCEQSLALFRAQGDEVREAHALYHAALITLYLGRWEDAKRYTVESKLRFAQLGIRHYHGFNYWCEGFLAHIFGDEAASEAAYMQSLAIAEAPQNAYALLALDVCVYLGVLHQSCARYEQALHYYQRSLAYAKQLDRQHQVCLILFRMGQVFDDMGRRGKAFLTYRRAINLVEKLGKATQREDVKINLLGTTQQIFGAMVLLCIKFFEQSHQFRWVKRAFSYVERARSRAFLDSLMQKNADANQTSIRDMDIVGLEELQTQLPEHSLLIEYFTTGVLPRGDHLYAYIPSANQKLRTILTLPATILGFAISHERCELFMPTLNPNRLRPQVGDSYPGRHLLLGHMPLTLYKQLIEPAAPMLTGKNLLYLIPHGPLHYIPFAALRTPMNTTLLDMVAEQSHEGLAIAQAPSATILRNCLQHRPGNGVTSLTMGYNDPEGEQPLRFAEAEAEHIGHILDAQSWLGSQSKRDQLRQQGQSFQYMHIAGHALFSPTDPMGSWLLLGKDDKLSAREIIDEVSLNAELITLSSCTSGLSHVVPGDELLGLPRALLYSGTPTVVCSRWEAVDIVTLLIMDRFYAELAQHSPAVALRNAQVTVRELSFEQLEHIFHAWVSQGGKLAEAIGDPELLLHDLAMIARYPGSESSALTQSRSADAPDALPTQAKPFDKPVLWASFMVIGRG